MTRSLLPPSIVILFILIIITILRHFSFREPQKIPLPPPQLPQESVQVVTDNSNSKIEQEVKEIKKSDVSVPILTYHYVGENPNPKDKARNSLSVTPFQFEQELDYLARNGYQSVTFKDLYAHLTSVKPLPERPMVLTFDDGYIDFYYNAYPILKKYNFSAVTFIPTGLVGRPGYLTWPMIEEISRLGGVEFGSHGVNHKDLTNLSNQELKKELEESKKVLESKSGKTVDFLAYPYGSFNQRVVLEAQRAGYKAAASTIFGETQMAIFYLL